MSIKRNFIYNAAMTGFNAVFPILTYPYVARILGPDRMGGVNYCNSVADWFVFLLMLGIPAYGIREIARVRDDQSKVDTVFTELLVINSISMALFASLYLCLYFVTENAHKYGVIYVMFSFPVLMSVFSFDWLFGGFEDFKYIAVRGIAIKIIVVCLTYILIRTSEDMGKYSALIVAGICLPNIINAFHSRKFVKINFSDIDLRRHVKPLLVIWGSILAGSVYTRGDTVLLGIFSTERSVAYYNVSKRVIGALLSITAALSNVLVSRMSYLHENNKGDEYKKLLNKSIEFIIFVSIPMVAIAMLSAAFIISVMGGEKYMNAVPCFILLAPVILFTNMAGFLGSQIMIPTGNEKMILGMTFSSALISVVCNFFLIPVLHQNASSIAAVLAECFGVVVGMYLIRKQVSFLRMITSNWHFFAAGSVAGCMAYLLMNVTHLYALNAALSIGVFCVIYMAFLVVTKCPAIASICDVARNLRGK